jgi:uncharacterized protein
LRHMKFPHKLFEEYVESKELRSHCIEVSAIMRFLAREIGEDDERWADIGLLHDLDFEIEKDLASHGKKTAEILRAEGYPEDAIMTILSHNEEGTGVKRETKIDFCLSAADNISGLIHAYSLVRNGLDGMEVKGLKKKIKDKAFAAAVRRDLITDIGKAGIPLDRFLELAIKAVQSIAKEIEFA